MFSKVDIVFGLTVLVTFVVEMMRRHQEVTNTQETATVMSPKVIWHKAYLICSVLFLLMSLQRFFDTNRAGSPSPWVSGLIAVLYLVIVREKVKA